MTKKDYVLIARIVSTLSEPARSAAAAKFADELARDNPKFNRGIFLKACEGSK